MAEQRTAKRAAAWKPPRLMKLALGGTESGTKYHHTTYEGICPPSGVQAPAYRMPTSGDPPVGTAPVC